MLTEAEKQIDWDRKLSEVRFFIEASDYERTMCIYIFDREDPKTRFEQESIGISQVIGKLDGRPVNLSFTFGRINGMPVAYWDCISEVVDHAMIRKWFDDNYTPMWDGGTRRAFTNMRNVHHAIHAADEATASE